MKMPRWACDTFRFLEFIGDLSTFIAFLFKKAKMILYVVLNYE